MLLRYKPSLLPNTYLLVLFIPNINTIRNFMITFACKKKLSYENTVCIRLTSTGDTYVNIPLK